MIACVGIAVLEKAPLGIERVPAPNRHCNFVGLARQGRTVWASSDDVSCRIARHVLGCDLTGNAAEAAAPAFVESKLVPDLASGLRFAAGFPVLEAKPRVFVYFPRDAAPLPPDVVIRFLSPEDAMTEIRSVVTAAGERTEVRTGGSAAICAECTVRPLLTGRAVLSAGCPGSRREVPISPNEVLVSLPARLECLVHPR